MYVLFFKSDLFNIDPLKNTETLSSNKKHSDTTNKYCYGVYIF